MSDLISRQDAIEALGEEPEVWTDTEEEWAYRNAWVEHISAIKSLPSAEPLVLSCNGCRHVGTYDTDFPCSVCIRREKDYYEQER